MRILKNITPNVITLQMFNVAAPSVNGVFVNSVLVLHPGETVDESKWLVSDIKDASYNSDLINEFIISKVLSRIIV
jgi:hypothetical protein